MFLASFMQKLMQIDHDADIRVIVQRDDDKIATETTDSNEVYSVVAISDRRRSRRVQITVQNDDAKSISSPRSMTPSAMARQRVNRLLQERMNSTPSIRRRRRQRAAIQTKSSATSSTPLKKSRWDSIPSVPTTLLNSCLAAEQNVILSPSSSPLSLFTQPMAIKNTLTSSVSSTVFPQSTRSLPPSLPRRRSDSSSYLDGLLPMAGAGAIQLPPPIVQQRHSRHEDNSSLAPLKRPVRQLSGDLLGDIMRELEMHCLDDDGKNELDDSQDEDDYLDFSSDGELDSSSSMSISNESTETVSSRGEEFTAF